MKHFLKIGIEDFYPRVLTELASHPDLWDRHSIRKTSPGSPHTRMSDIWVRYNDSEPFEASGNWKGFNDLHIPVWYEAWEQLPSLKPILFRLMAKVQGEMLGGVLITRIPPGGRIDPHRDDSWHVRYFDKFYLSLQSGQGADFCCIADTVTERLNPKPGEIWRFDNKKLHWVENNSDEDRITLIVCIRTEKFKDLT